MLLNKDEQRELLRQNQELKRQLEKAYSLISNLSKQNDELKHKLAQQQNRYSHQTPQKPKMQVLEHFQNSSQEETNSLSDPGDQTLDKQIAPTPLAKINSEKLNLSTSMNSKGQTANRKPNTKVFIYSEEDVPKKSIKNILKKSSERKKQFSNVSSDQPISIKSVSTKQIPLPMPSWGKEFSLRSEKSLFKKTSNSRPIFEHFFVTGVTKNGPCIIYSYPQDYSNFGGHLALIYGQNYLRSPDLSPSNSRSKITPSLLFKDSNPAIIKRERECFVVPVIKSKQQSAERDYLFVMQSEEPILQKNDKELSTCVFTRYYCFLTQWKFFSQFKNLCTMIVERIQNMRKKKDFKTEVGFGVDIGQQIQQSLSFLYQKSTDYNKTIDCCIGNEGFRFSADIPPIQSSFQMIDKYIQHKLFNTTVFVKTEAQQSLETKLYGILMAYGLSETKIVLYSNNKVKVSQTIMEFLQLIRPLTYVNPIIISAIKEEHQTYLDAPMGLMLGLWSQTKKSNKQKIQIFMNKKLNLAGMIEKAKLSISEGIVINLDTGLVFGGSINSKLNQIAVKLNKLNLWKKQTRNLRDYYKFVERMLLDRCESQQIKAIWSDLMPFLKKTQLYCYYTQNRQD